MLIVDMVGNFCRLTAFREQPDMPLFAGKERRADDFIDQ